MPTFEYQGRSARGELAKGRLEAATTDAAASALLEQGITPVNIQQVVAASSMNVEIGTLLGGKKIQTVDLIMFCRQMYTIAKSGIPLVRGIRGLAAGLKHA